MSMSDIKRSARRALHSLAAEPCRYVPDDAPYSPSAEQLAEGLTLTVRFKSKARAMQAESDAVMILENVESLIFQADQLQALGLTLESGALVQVPGYEITFQLDQPMDPDGPLNVYWTVTRSY